jgi:hypothetical protein
MYLWHFGGQQRSGKAIHKKDRMAVIRSEFSQAERVVL